MKRIYLLLVVSVLSLVVLGCGTKAQNPVAPTSTVQAIHALPVGQSWVDKNGTTWTRLDSLHMQSVTIGKITVIYVCDYPLGSSGPPAPGHCYTDGSGCV